jgi:hypothetical protein
MPHNFDIDVTMTATINSTVAMQMIIDAVERQTGQKVADIFPKYDGTMLDAFHIVFDPHTTIKRKSFKPSKEFVVENFGAEE